MNGKKYCIKLVKYRIKYRFMKTDLFLNADKKFYSNEICFTYKYVIKPINQIYFDQACDSYKWPSDIQINEIQWKVLFSEAWSISNCPWNFLECR